jgi:hypothetical protein
MQLILGPEHLTLFGSFKCFLQLQLLRQDQRSNHRDLLTVFALLKITEAA